MVRGEGAQAPEAARLTCTVLWPGRGKLEASPYRDLAGASHWEDAAREFVRQCCGLMGLVRARSTFKDVRNTLHVWFVDIAVR